MKPIKLLAISASPRLRGNSQYLLERALEGLRDCGIPVEVTRYSFAGKSFRGCIGCLKCYGNGGQCVIKDDFQALRQLWLDSDCVIYCSPVYVAGIPGQLKCFIDRLNNSEFGLYPVLSVRHMKAIGAILQGGDFPGGQELGMVDIMRHAAMANCLYVAPDGSYFGSGGWADGPEGTELEKKAARGAPDASIMLNTAQSTVRRCVEMAAIVRCGAEVLSGELLKDQHYKYAACYRP